MPYVTNSIPSTTSPLNMQVVASANENQVPAGYILVSNGTNADWTPQASDLSTYAYEIFEPGV
jgi:hypothetical protein